MAPQRLAVVGNERDQRFVVQPQRAQLVQEPPDPVVDVADLLVVQSAGQRLDRLSHLTLLGARLAMGEHPPRSAFPASTIAQPIVPTM